MVLLTVTFLLTGILKSRNVYSNDLGRVSCMLYNVCQVSYFNFPGTVGGSLNVRSLLILFIQIFRVLFGPILLQSFCFDPRDPERKNFCNVNGTLYTLSPVL